MGCLAVLTPSWQRSVDCRALASTALAAAGCLVPTPWISLPAALALTLWLPGRSLLGILPPRDEYLGRTWIALAAAFVLVPVPLTALWSFSNDRAAVLVSLLGLNLLLILWRMLAVGRSRGGPERTVLAPRPPTDSGFLTSSCSESVPVSVHATRASRVALALLLLFTGGCVWASLYLPEAGGRIAPRPAHDYIKHHAVLLSLGNSPLPLHNYFYAAERDTPYHYYHYHYLVPAALRKLGGDRASIGLTFALTSGLLAMVFAALVFLLARELFGGRSRWAPWWAAACVTIIGGWDVIPVLLHMWQGAAPVVVLDSWIPSPWRIHNLMTQYIWCPQHISGALIVLLAAWWLRQSPRGAWWVVMGPLLATALFGTSLYLAMTTFSAAAIYLISRAVDARRQGGRLGTWLLAAIGMGGVAVALMLPQILGYLEMNRRGVGGLTVTWPRFDHALVGRLAEPGVLANWLDAPWIWLTEFGVLAIAAVLVGRSFWRDAWRDPGLRLLLLAGAVGLAVVYTIRSSHAMVDYSFRVSVMPAQVFAALCVAAACVRTGSPLRSRRLLGGICRVSVLMGLPVGLYEAPMMAVRTWLRPPAEQQDAGAIRFLREHTPPDAVIQGDPRDRVSLPQLTHRGLGVADLDNSHVRVFYPQNICLMRATCGAVEQALREDDAARAHVALAAAGVEYVLFGAAELRRGARPQAFADNDRFEQVYVDEKAAVFRLRRDEVRYHESKTDDR